MPNEKQIRELARKVLHAGTIPRRDPDRTWGGIGVDMPCTICGHRILRGQVEYELQFSHDGANPGLDRFHLHLRCFSAWEMERTKFLPRGHAAPARDDMTTPFPDPTPPEPLPFSITGPIASWDPIDRRLQIGERHCWLTSGVSVLGVSPGAEVLVVGHVEHLADAGARRWFVTQLTLV